MRVLLLNPPHPDLINAMHATPHRWTPFHEQNAGRGIVELDQSRWDYRHQVLASRVPPWRVFMWVKLTEAAVQLRPRALWRVLFHRDRKLRRALHWCYGVAARAVLFELREFLSGCRRKPGPGPGPGGRRTLGEFWGG